MNHKCNLRQERKIKRFPKISALTLSEVANFRVAGDKFSLKVSCDVQPTDDGKKLKVNVSNVEPFQQLVSTTVLWAVAELPTQNASSGSLQQAIASPASPKSILGNTNPLRALEATQDRLSNTELKLVNEEYVVTEREITFVWKSLPNQIRDSNLESQKVFNTEKETICGKEAVAAGGGYKFEIARNKCWTRFYKARTPELKKLLAAG